MDEPVAGLDVVVRDYFYHKLMEEAVILRFGMKFFWVLWAVWMLAALLPLNISKNEKLSTELAKIGLMVEGKITPAGIVTAVSLVVLILIVITWKILKRQRVTA